MGYRRARHGVPVPTATAAPKIPQTPNHPRPEIAAGFCSARQLTDCRDERRKSRMPLVRDQKEFGGRLDDMHLNPVRNGLASRPEGWRWSSYSNFALDKDTVACCPIEIDPVTFPNPFADEESPRQKACRGYQLASRRGGNTLSKALPRTHSTVHVNLQLTIDSEQPTTETQRKIFSCRSQCLSALRGETLWHRRCQAHDTGRAREIPPAPIFPQTCRLLPDFSRTCSPHGIKAFSGALQIHKRLEAELATKSIPPRH